MSGIIILNGLRIELCSRVNAKIHARKKKKDPKVGLKEVKNRSTVVVVVFSQTELGEIIHHTKVA